MPIRRSGRRSGARKSYTDDPFKAIGLEESGDEENEENTERSVDPPGKEDGKAKKRKRESDDEFDEQAAASPEEESIDDEDIASENEASQSDEPVPEEEEEEDEELVKSAIGNRSSVTGGNRTGRYRERKVDGSLRFLPQETHSRGVFNPSEHVSRSMHIKLSFGLDDRDLLAVVNARSRWTMGIDSTFPSRPSLDKGPTATDYGPGNTHGVYAADLKREATAGWDWYYNNQYGSNFKKKQRVESITEAQAQQKFLYMPKKNSLKVIYGPGDSQTSTQLPHHDSINFGNAWKNRDETHKVGKKDTTKKKGKKKSNEEAPDDEVAKEEPPLEEPRRKNRYGWFLNVSGKIQALAWAPNQSDMTQYLAVSVPINSEQERQYNPPGPPTVSPAFSSSPPYPGSIQIWSFDAEEREEYITKTLDVEQKPKLKLVLCMEFGHIRKLNWCSIPRKKRDEDEEGSTKSLGLLACVFTDGCTRVLDVKLNNKSDATEYVYVHAAAFTVMPSPTVSTCMAWLSPTDIVVGCANGSVSVYNIVTCDTSRPDEAPIPYITFPVHMTYINNIQTGYPQHPQIISTVSMDGNTRLTSLNDPAKDVVDTQRQRMGATHISYNPFLQAFISSDENDFVRGLSVRRFYTTTSIGRLPSTVSAIASGSRWHPSTIVGSTEGSVFLFNALRRFMHSKEPHFHAKWFLHEWARGKDDQTPDTVRFTDEVEVEGLNLTRATRGDGKVVNGVMGITVYDEQQHVLGLEWNPNQHCAGWVAAGMGSGVIRVEDLAMFH